MLFKIVFQFALLVAIASLGQGFFFYSNRCSFYNPASVTACAVTDLCALTGADRDTAVTCLRGQVSGRLILPAKIQTCDANGSNTCVSASHCVDLAVERCGTCANTPRLLTIFGCKANCGYSFGTRLRQCLSAN